MAKTTPITQTILIDQLALSRLITLYKDHQHPNPTEYVFFFAKTDDFTVTVYRGTNPQYKVVYQGLHFSQDVSLFSSAAASNSSLFVDHYGSDEVGTGDFFGPVVVTASFVNAVLAKKLIALGVKDSKDLTDEAMKHIFNTIKDDVISVSIIVSPEKYKTLIDKGLNLNAIKARMHHHALMTLREKIEVDTPMIIDQFATEKNMNLYLRDLKKIPFLQLHEKAENKFLAVAISSIIARVKFLSRIELLSKTYQTKIPLGASPFVEKFALDFAKKHGLETLKKITKSNFKTLTRIIDTLAS
jgi:ribonuclease HIII